MTHTEQIEQLAASLAVAQGQMIGALKTSANPFFKSKYADLQSVWEACRLPLSNNGLSVVQSPSIRREAVNADVNTLRDAINEKAMPPEVVVTTMLMHVSGQWIRNELSMWPKDNSPQAIGSCISYARRYALAALVGVYQADDDAELAQTGHGPPAGVGEAITDYMDQLVEAIKDNDTARARSLWNELNVVGATPEIWRTLNTKQKKTLRELLQVTQAVATPTQQMTAPPQTESAGEPDSEAAQ